MPATTERTSARRGRSSSVASNASNASNAAAAAPALAGTPVKSQLAALTEEAQKSSALDRPELPQQKNPRLPAGEVPVKLQVIKREGKNIVIGRVKLPTLNGSDHAFLLKRFDTNAMAASSMFRLAFPFADGEAERKEMAYLERRFDCNLANGGPGRVEANASVAGTDDEAGNASETGIKTPKRGRGRPRKVQPKVEEDAAEGSAAATAPVSNGTTNAVPASGSTGVRLQGTWVPAADAIEIAEEYGLLTYARPLIEARTVPAADGSETPVLAERIDPTIPPGTRPIKRLRIPPVDEVKLVYAYNEAEAEAKRKAASGSGSGSPSVVRTRTTRTTLPDGSEEVRVETTETSIVSEDADEEMAGPDSGSGAAQALSQTEIESQIAQAKALAANVQSSSTTAGAGSTGTKRRATTEASAELDALASDEEDEEEEERGNFQGFATDRRIRPIVRTLRRGARSARARPIATTAGVLTAASAIGAGAAAWLAPASVEAGFQLLQQGVQNIGWGGWFF